MKPTISISFLDHVMFPKVADCHLRFRLLAEPHHLPLTEDLQFHILELPKFTKSPAELTSGLDVWLYFLRHAAMMDTEALPIVMQDPLMVRALEELKVLTQTNQERERYEARRKVQHDEQTKLKAAQLQLEAARLAGRLEGEIHMCQRLLNQPETATAELAALSIDELTRLAAELEEQVRKRR